MKEARERRIEVKLHQEKDRFLIFMKKGLEYKSCFRKIELSISVKFFKKHLEDKEIQTP